MWVNFYMVKLDSWYYFLKLLVLYIVLCTSFLFVCIFSYFNSPPNYWILHEFCYYKMGSRWTPTPLGGGGWLQWNSIQIWQVKGSIWTIHLFLVCFQCFRLLQWENQVSTNALVVKEKLCTYMFWKIVPSKLSS